MKLPETWYRLFEARVSERMEPIRQEYENDRNRNAGLDHNQRMSRDAEATINFTLKLFELETQILIETYREWGRGYPDDQDYDDLGRRLDSVGQAHISHFDHAHTNVFSQQNEYIYKRQLEFVEMEVKSNVGRALSPLYTFILEGKAKAEDAKTASIEKPSSEAPIYMRFNPTAAEKVWLEAVYNKLRKNEEINPTQMLVELWEKLPKNFNYKDIDPRLIFFGVDITLLGILQIDPDTDLVSKTDIVIQRIKQAIKEDPKITSINSVDIADSTGFSKHEVSIIFGLLQHLGNFWNGGASDNTGYRQVNIGHQSTLREYLSYENINELLLTLYLRKDLRQIHTSEDEQLEVFPLTPSKVTRGVFYQYEVNDICSEEDFQQLVKLMFDYPDRSFYRNCSQDF